MRLAVAAFTDVLAVAVFVYLAFRLALVVTPCGSLSDCFPLVPVTILLVVISVSAYFGGAAILWRRSPGQKLWRTEE